MKVDVLGKKIHVVGSVEVDEGILRSINNLKGRVQTEFREFYAKMGKGQYLGGFTCLSVQVGRGERVNLQGWTNLGPSCGDALELEILVSHDGVYAVGVDVATMSKIYIVDYYESNYEEVEKLIDAIELICVRCGRERLPEFPFFDGYSVVHEGKWVRVGEDFSQTFATRIADVCPVILSHQEESYLGIHTRFFDQLGEYRVEILTGQSVSSIDCGIFTLGWDSRGRLNPPHSTVWGIMNDLTKGRFKVIGDY